LLTVDEIQNMIATATDSQDRALIACLWESGARIGELLGILRKHVTMDAIGAVLVVQGKTGMRRIRVIESAPYLDEWIAKKSLRPDDGVFPHNYSTAARKIKQLAKKAGIEKRIYPHLFRHSRATYLAGYLTEAQLCQYMGWTIGSAMARIYVHLSGQDLDAALTKLPSVLTPVTDIK
jgi:integrase/recombinase XerD